MDVRPLMRTNDDFMRAAVQFDEANPKLKEGFSAALAAQGFVADTSALNWAYIEEWSRPVLNQSTHINVASSSSSTVLNGPSRRTHSAL